MKTLKWEDDHLEILDQTKLPLHLEYINCYSHLDVCEAITSMKVRGAPAIGAASAYGMLLGTMEKKGAQTDIVLDHLERVSRSLISSRPTAVNLSWAVNRVFKAVKNIRPETYEQIYHCVYNEAEAICSEDIKINKAIGRWGASIVPDKAAILTHCNAGALATVDYGTALGVIRAAVEAEKEIKVFADETRPNLQGARLTTWELLRDGIDVTLIVDSAAGLVMKKGLVDMIVVGADRIAANGDVANKIGTYSLAVLADKHKIPFYVAAPYSTFDLSKNDGDEIAIEERSRSELSVIGQTPIAPPDVKVFNPAFDVTPSDLLSGIITEYGIIKKSDMEDICGWFKKAEEL